MAQPVIVQGIKIFFVDLVGGLLGFPVWWYTRGLAKWSRFVWEWFSGYRARLAIGVWVKNLFVPMYGSYDIAGRIISFFMRSAMIVIRSFGLVLFGIFAMFLFLLYLVLPVGVAVMIVYHILGLVV